ncbi:MAG TPA: DUF6531 domain-containing protein [Verrucomicrobiae bacterium]|nr:DUF6531 domain-containing protein [Verrucomicrobiae bacterium]
MTSLNGTNFAGPDGGTFGRSFYLAVWRTNVMGSTGDWNISASATATVRLVGTGTYPIWSNDISGWSSGYMNVTIPANSLVASVLVSIATTTNIYYDRTGAFQVQNNAGVSPPTSLYTNFPITVEDYNTPYGVAAYVGGALNSSVVLLQGGTGGANSYDLRFYREYGVSARTVNYSILTGDDPPYVYAATPGVDYTPVMGSTYPITFPLGSTAVDVIVSANDLLETNNTVFDVELNSGNYQILDGGRGETVCTMLEDFPSIGLTASASPVAQGQGWSLEFYNTNAYAATPAETVNYTVGGTASNGVDYTPTLSGSITIPAGSSYIITNIVTALHTNVVGTKTVTVTVSPSSLYSIISGASSATLGIVQNYPTLDITAPSGYSSPNSNYLGNFTITRAGSLSNSITAHLAIGGTATAGTDYTALLNTITFGTNQTSTNLYVYALNPSLSTDETVVVSLTPNSTYVMGLNTNAIVTLVPNSVTTNSVTSPQGRYWRGSGADPTYWSIVTPLDFETGTVYSNINGNCSNLYSGLASWNSQTFYHYNASNSLSQAFPTNRIPFNNPIVAFGERVGGTPLYYNQAYQFGIYAGDTIFSNTPIIIQAYYRTNYQLAGTVTFYPPNVLASTSNQWVNFLTNGFQLSTNAFGLTTIVSGQPYLTYGESGYGAVVLTQTASTQATNYYYVVGMEGYPADGNYPMAMDGSGNIQPSSLYSLEFEARPPWRSVFLDQPHFAGKPLPPFYDGMTLAQMATNSPPVTNAVSFTPSSATNLDDSPELRRSPILDNFVASMNNDPIALANYVINQIALTDPIDYSDDGNVSEQSVNLGGITRGAQGAFLEKQGSPWDQCALLVYLLRRAGVPAVYELAPRNGLMMLDSRLSQLLKFQVHGDLNSAGVPYTTNTMIAVNYPWVAAYIGTNWVHIFPWIKDTEITQGLNLWEEMPANYTDAYQWVRDYIYGNTNLLSLATNGDNTPRVIFPAYLHQTLLQNHPGVSVDDIGTQIVNRQHYYATWGAFPTPTWVTNVSTPLESLSSSAITNVDPGLTNIFETVSIEIFSNVDPTKDIKTGDLPLVLLENREFYIYQFMTNGNVQLNLTLMPWLANNTTVKAFTNDVSLTNKEVLSLNFDQYDSGLTVEFRYKRHRAMLASTPIGPNGFLGVNTDLGFGPDEEVDLERPLNVGDQAALCIDYGQVSTEMLNADAQSLWQMEQTLQANPSQTNSLSPDVYEGELMYLAGMSYYQKCDQFDKFNQQVQGFDEVSRFAAGLSKIIPARNSQGVLTNGVDPVLPCVDMFFYEDTDVGNDTTQPSSGQDLQMAENNFIDLAVVDYSAEEHQVINTFYQQTNAVSTVRLLQLAQSSGAGIVPISIFNYATVGTNVYQGKQLQNWDPYIWQNVLNVFEDYSQLGYMSAYLTPGPMTNAAYAGMGAMVFSPSINLALISPNSLNGGVGTLFNPGTITANNSLNYNVNVNSDNYTVTLNAPSSSSQTLAPDLAADFNVPLISSLMSSGNYTFSTTGTSENQSSASLFGLSQSTSSSAQAFDFQTSAQNGNVGTPTYPSSFFGSSSDPVVPLTGEFRIDESDLGLPGPIPLVLRRNYSSQNLADNQFGYGWKLSIMPYLVVSINATNIYAADMDGAVLDYVHSTNSASTNLWSPTLAANPQLNNDSIAGAGSLANRLRDYILLSVNGSTTNYTLYGADGSVRAFQWMNFNSGTITNDRPYLTQWTDNCGNYYTFSYDTNTADADYGQMTRIKCSNGNYFNFDYDIYGHMVDAYTGDGRWIYYDYDQYGDLTTVTRPDGSEVDYDYLHSMQSVTNGSVVTQQPYSTHLVIEEDDPDGREVLNAFDSQRRVTNQWTTAGSDLTPILTSKFVYSNNFNITNSWTNTISGSTFVTDANGGTNRYDYTNSLITKITDPLGYTIQQTWYADNATVPGYPRSLQRVVDKRGLVIQYLYDSNGNVTNTVYTGDLTGDGIATQTATNTAIYNTNSLLVQMTDPIGNSVVTVYDPVYSFEPSQIIQYASGIPVSTNYMLYGNATNVVQDGNLLQTNIAIGLNTRAIRAYGSTDAATNDTFYSGQGFPAQTIQYTGTGDPNITNYYFYNERGLEVDRVDALGAITYFDYDPMNRPTEKENYDEFGNTLSLTTTYYNENGETNWMDGPQYNPDNYNYFDYDGAGRLTTRIHWRSEANSSGTGVEQPAGYNLYAQTFYEYDPVGDLTLMVDPRGAMTTNQYDLNSRLTESTHLDTDGATVLSTDGYSYEPGGEVQSHTNALGGVTTTYYNIMGKPEYQINADGSTNGWRYYLDGRIYKQFQGNGAYWQTTYNDANRITTQVFCSAAGVPEATNSVQLDRRGNTVQTTDAGFNVFNSTYDGLDRIKNKAGPAIVTVTEHEDMNFNVTYVTNVLQHTLNYFYDSAGRFVTTTNALGEMTVKQFDAIGRPRSTKNYNAKGALARESYTGYSLDNNSVTVTNGSGSSAIVDTTWIDTDGHTVLSIAYPSSGTTEFTENQYDLAGNPILSQHDSSTGGSLTNWTSASSTFDGLNRVTSTTDRDGAVTHYAYDPLNDPTNRTMPQGLQWEAAYNNAGQVVQDSLVGTGGLITRQEAYGYYPAGNPLAGLLETNTDGRGFVSTYSYDDWLRKTSVTRTDSYYNHVDTSYGYDARGYTTNITEQNTGYIGGSDPKVVLRTFDAYGQLSSETITWNGSTNLNAAGASSATQSWDAAGRRTGLSINGAGYNYGWNADGTLIYASSPGGSGYYSFDTAGLLTNRVVGSRMTAVTSRDGEGRPLTVGTTVSLTPELTETLSYSADGLINSDTLNRADFTDSRSYAYANLSRRLTYEQLNLNNSATWTNNFTYDNGVSGGPGVLTQMGAPSPTLANWNGGVSPFFRVNVETNTSINYPAYGRVNGLSTLTAWLDGQPLAVMTNSSGDTNYPFQWRTVMPLTPGTHQLTVSALHPSGVFTAWATNWFTNSLAGQTATIGRDNDGNITQRIWRKPDGTIIHQQQLFWDAKDRLIDMTDGDGSQNGFYLHAVYDGLDRRVLTQYWPMVNGQILTYIAAPININQYYDPLVEFQELGVGYGNTTEWKLYGPDLNGQYGGMNGVGGFDGVSPGLNLFYPTISDIRGNILGEVTNGAVAWNPARPTGYGAVSGYRPVALGHGANVVQSSAWRGRWVDLSGYYNLGTRMYDPVAGMWLSYDPTWNARDPNYLSFCGGDPINGFDSNGRCVQNAPQNLYFGVAPVMDTFLETKTFFLDGTSASTGLPGEPSSVIYDPNTVGGNEYNWVTMQTGQSAFYVSQTPLPANFGNTISTPITQADLEEQADIQFIKTVAVVAGTAMTGTEEAAPELLAPETYYRTMSEADYSQLLNTGQIPATGETFISPSLEYAQQYNGVTVQFNVQAGTQNALMDMGVRNSAAGFTGTAYESLPLAQSGWGSSSAFFKWEGENLVNIGLGQGPALQTFNNNIINFTLTPVPKP